MILKEGDVSFFSSTLSDCGWQNPMHQLGLMNPLASANTDRPGVETGVF